MSVTDDVLNGVLIAMVCLQIRGRRPTVRKLVLPVAPPPGWPSPISTRCRPVLAALGAGAAGHLTAASARAVLDRAVQPVLVEGARSRPSPPRHPSTTL